MVTTSECSLRIENIVSSGAVADSIDIDLLIKNSPDCKFDKKRFPGAVYYMQDPKAVALIFSSGRIVLTGVTRHEHIDVSLQNLLDMLKKSGITCMDTPSVSVKNIVCTYNLGNECNLVRIMAALMDHEWVEYEPESFPGLVCRITDPKIVFLLFSSGKTVVTGGTNMENIRKGVRIFTQKLGSIGVL